MGSENSKCDETKQSVSSTDSSKYVYISSVVGSKIVCPHLDLNYTYNQFQALIAWSGSIVT
jgi:hypothetical protein